MVIDIEMDEMKRTVKTDDDARSMALKEIGKSVKGEYATISELMDKENEIRKAYGLPLLTKYPVLEMEYSPATQQSVWKKIVAVRIVRKAGQIPYGDAIYEDVENFDPSRRLGEIMPIVEKKLSDDYPGMNFSKEEKEPIIKMIRLSIIKKMQLDAGTDKNAPLPDYLKEEEVEAPVKKVRAKKE